tara:strand:- start:7068 stop:7901 length:834 start_codon:yes stop_codon:yes gene_type:complete
MSPVYVPLVCVCRTLRVRIVLLVAINLTKANTSANHALVGPTLAWGWLCVPTAHLDMSLSEMARHLARCVHPVGEMCTASARIANTVKKRPVEYALRVQPASKPLRGAGVKTVNLEKSLLLRAQNVNFAPKASIPSLPANVGHAIFRTMNIQIRLEWALLTVSSVTRTLRVKAANPGVSMPWVHAPSVQLDTLTTVQCQIVFRVHRLTFQRTTEPNAKRAKTENGVRVTTVKIAQPDRLARAGVVHCAPLQNMRTLLEQINVKIVHRGKLRVRLDIL